MVDRDDILEAAGKVIKTSADPLDTLKMRRIPKASDTILELITGKNKCSEPVPGTPVYCDLAIVAEHTGIYIGDNKIVHLNGNGKIEAVTPQEFVSRLDGANPAETIYFAVANGKAVGNKKIADRAKAMIGKRRQYNVLLDNCHQFTCGCLSGDFENPCNYFTLVQAEIISRFGIFSWKEWDY